MADFREAFQTQVTAIGRHAPGVAVDADPEVLHKLRVAIRRLRALLQAARPFLADESSESLRAELRELGNSVGPARDADVFLAYLRDANLDGDGDQEALAQVVTRVEDVRRETYAAARAALDAPAFARLMEELGAFSSSVVVRDASKSELIDPEARKLRKAVRDLTTNDGLHRARIKAKRVRYAAEAAGVKGVVTRAKKLQDVLGEHQDAVVAEERLRELSEPATALVIGRLIERQEARRASALADVPKAWRKLDKAIA